MRFFKRTPKMQSDMTDVLASAQALSADAQALTESITAWTTAQQNARKARVLADCARLGREMDAELSRPYWD